MNNIKILISSFYQSITISKEKPRVFNLSEGPCLEPKYIILRTIISSVPNLLINHKNSTGQSFPLQSTKLWNHNRIQRWSILTGSGNVPDDKRSDRRGGKMRAQAHPKGRRGYFLPALVPDLPEKAQIWIFTWNLVILKYETFSKLHMVTLETFLHRTPSVFHSHMLGRKWWAWKSREPEFEFHLYHLASVWPLGEVLSTSVSLSAKWIYGFCKDYK